MASETTYTQIQACLAHPLWAHTALAALRLAYQEICAVLLNEPAVQDFRTAAFVVALRKIGTTHLEMGV